MINESEAVRLATRALVENGRGPHDVSDVWYDDVDGCWSVHFRPRIPGMETTDVIDGGPVVIVSSTGGEPRIVDMMSLPD